MGAYGPERHRLARLPDDAHGTGAEREAEPMARIIIAIGFLTIGAILVTGFFDPRILDWLPALFGG